jgi:hypothetical protein
VSGAMSSRETDAHGRSYWIRGRLEGTMSDSGALSVTGTVTVDGHWADGGYLPPYYVPKTAYDLAFEATGTLYLHGDHYDLDLALAGGGSVTWSQQP